MSDEPDTPEGKEGLEGSLSTIRDAVGDLITGIPTPIRKNAARAFARLCTAAVEYPVTVIESAIAERRAESQARVKLIATSVQQIAAQMQTDPEYARAAVKKFAHKIIRERVNLDQIAGFAAAELKSEQSHVADNGNKEASPISEDWLNVFESEGAPISSEHMQRFLGRILAGEIRAPSSYSIKTLKLIVQLDNQALVLFKKLCSLAVTLVIPAVNVILDARVVPLQGNAASNSLQRYGLGFDQLNVLHEYGLIIADYDSYMDYRPAVTQGGQVTLPVIYQKTQWAFVPKEAREGSQEFRVHGVAFSRSGREVLPIVEVEPDQQYTADLKAFFEAQHMIMTAVGPAREVP
jgi:hypothetical protein